MKKIFFILLILLAHKAHSQLTTSSAFPNLSFSNPVLLTHAGDGTNRIFVVEKGGLIKVFPNDSMASSTQVFLNVTNLISTNYTEKGLLGLAFHPNYSSNRYLYIYYTRLSDGALTVTRFTTFSGNPNKADSLSALPIITIAHPTNLNHNGGNLMFGLDGYLYLGPGDGGSGGDPPNNAQNVNVLLGKILRLDVNNPSGGNNYGIPPSNPFASGGGAPEIFAWGVRNPWRFTQDPVTGLIYCGDVGQNIYEEVDILQVGKNYGWRVMEGFHCYNPSSGCDTTGKTLPIYEYDHTSSRCSITGGYVYRGPRVPTLTGRYVFGDYCGRQVYKFLYSGGVVTETAQILTVPTSLLSFGTDQNNELYLLCTGGIYKMSGVVISINGNQNEIPEGFTLEQNYPNPFNPVTNIKFTVPQASMINIKVYDAAGRQTSELVNEIKNAGTYNVEFNALNLPSGVYFYKMTINGAESIEKKMVLVK